jgi:hypothetical protein
MAFSREVDIILRANAASVQGALRQIQGAANATANAATRAVLEGYASKLGDTAASIVSNAIDSSNEKFRTSLTETVNKASLGISAGIRAAMDANDDQIAAERLLEVRKQMAALEKLANADTQKDLALGLRDVFSSENAREFGSFAADSFEKALNGMDPNDLGGFVKSLGGAASKGLAAGAKAVKARETAARASGDVAKADALAKVATVMTGTAVAIVGIAAALALFVAWMKAADDYQAKLNKTLLEGASVADVMGVAYQEGARQGASLTEVMNDAREAALETAVQFKMSTDETARVLQDLNSAGITYKRIIDGASTAAERQHRFAEAINQTIVYSSMLGVSVSELAQYQNTLMKDVNLTLDRTFDVFQAISDASLASGMTTKTFFTAISQATSGMALYNVRIGQAIGFVKSFSKIVGEADAGKVLGDLTGKKGVDERLRIGATAIEAVGLKKVQDLFRRTTEAGADDFQKTFAGFGGAIIKVFRDAGQEALGQGLMSGDAGDRAKAAAALAKLPDDIREQIKAGMEGIEGGAASRKFGAFALSARGTVGGVDEVSGVMNQLDMAGKILLMDYQARIMEKDGARLEDAATKATLQKFMETIGLDETQLEPLLRYRQYAAAVERVRAPGAETVTDRTMLEGQGFTVAGDRVMKGDKEIRNLADVVYGLGVQMESEEAAQTRRDATEKQRMQGTITDALNAWVQGKLFENALADQGLLGQILKYVSKDEYDPEKMAAAREAKIAALEKAQTGLDEARAITEEDGSPAARATLADAEAGMAAARFGAGLTSGVGVSGRELESAVGRSSDIGVLLAEELSAYQQAAVGAMTGRGAAFDDEAKKQLEALASELLGRPVEASFDVKGGVKITPTETPTPTPATDVKDAFISKDGAMYRGPSADNILMFKDGGPLDPRTGGGGGGNVVINIHGGDQAMVYRTVARAMRAAQG